MNPLGTASSNGPALSPQELAGLRDYWAIFEAHMDEINREQAARLLAQGELAELLRAPAPEVAAGLQHLRRALQGQAIMNGEWQPYQAALGRMGASYAQAGLDFQVWAVRTGAFRKSVLPFLLEAYGRQPQRLAQALLGLDLLVDWMQVMIGQGYLGAREQMSHSQQEALYDASAARQAETKFRGLLESAPDGIVIVDSAGRMTLVNSQTEKMFGYPREALLGQPVEMLLPQRLRAAHPGHRADYFAAPRVRQMGVGLVLSGLRRDGREFPVEISLSPLETEGGTLVIASIRDITERRQTEESLRRSEERSSLLLDNIREYAILMLDPHGTIISWNAGAERLKGYRAAEIIGRHFSVFYPPEALAEDKPQHELEVAAAEGRFEEDGWRVRQDGSRFWANVIITALRDSRGELIGFGKVTRDLTARQEFETTLHEKNLELENALLARDRFLSSMSHELRTPLNAIIGFTGTLLMRLPGPLTADQEKQLQTVRTSARHLLSLINDLLDVAKIDSGKLQLNLEPVDGQEVLAEVAATLRPLAEAKGLRFVLDQPAGPLRLQTDRRSLSQILVNLANNAIKFTDAGEVRLALAQASGPAPQPAVFTVTDTGVGIAPEGQARMFRAFEQVGSPGARWQEGTGLGLYLSQKLAGLLGGRIEFESDLGKGSVFRLVIPGDT